MLYYNHGKGKRKLYHSKSLKGGYYMYLKNKSKQIVVRVSAEQYELLEYYSSRFNGTKSDFIRILIDWFTSLEVDNNEKK